MRCRTQGCPETVEYEHQPVIGVFGKEPPPPPGRRRIYLTCPSGHTHCYVVWNRPLQSSR